MSVECILSDCQRRVWHMVCWTQGNFFFSLIVKNKINVGQTPVLQLCSHSSCFVKALSAAILNSWMEFNPRQDMRTHWGRQRIHLFAWLSWRSFLLTVKIKKRSGTVQRPLTIFYCSHSVDHLHSSPPHFSIILLFTIIRLWRHEWVWSEFPCLTSGLLGHCAENGILGVGSGLGSHWGL